MGEHEERNREDRANPDHKPQGDGKQTPPDPDKPPGRHAK